MVEVLPSTTALSEFHCLYLVCDPLADTVAVPPAALTVLRVMEIDTT